MSIKPFNDAPPLVVPVLKQRTSTKPFDRYRQGVSLTSNPALQRGIINFTAANEIVYGQAVKANPSPLFNDSQNYRNLDHQQIKSFDGAMEPFTIRYVTEFNPIFGRLVKHSIKAHICAGNSKLFGGSDVVQQLILTKLQVSSSVPFIDLSTPYLMRIVNNPPGSPKLGPGAMLSEPEPINVLAGTINPFNDTTTKQNIQLNDSMPSDMKNALLTMDPASYHLLLPLNHISARAGFIYDNISPFTQGTDSLAFGFDY